MRLDTIKLDIGQFQVGRVQISQHGQWGGVCGTGWDDRDARVTCRELGYPYAKVRKTLSSFLPPATKLWQGYVFKGVCDSVHRGGGMHGRGMCVTGGMRGRGACVARETTTAADDTHPTGMHSCLSELKQNNSSFSFFTFQMLHSAKL